MWRHLMQNNSIIHFNTKMQKILFQVCKRMNFLLNCQFFICTNPNYEANTFIKIQEYGNIIFVSFFHGETRWRKHLALMQS